MGDAVMFRLTEAINNLSSEISLISRSTSFSENLSGMRDHVQDMYYLNALCEIADNLRLIADKLKKDE